MVNQYDNYGDRNVLTPPQCRTGPVQQRSCTDSFCCFLYLILILAVIFFGILCVTHVKLSNQTIQQQLIKNDMGKPLLSIVKATGSIIASEAVAIALCLILSITTFIFPSIVAYLYIPLILLTMLALGAAFLYRYIGNYFPFINKDLQNRIVASQSIAALIIAILFLVAFVISIITIFFKKQKFRSIISVLRMAKICIWDNFHMFIIAIALSTLSIIFVFINLLLLEISQTRQLTVGAQLHLILAILIIVQLLWTHGFMMSLSDFLFQSFTIHWYFNRKAQGQNYSICEHNLSPTLGLVVKHIGTISFGSFLAYYPDLLHSWLSTMERVWPGCYGACCYFHKCMCRKFSKYGHTETILQGLSLCPALDQLSHLRKKTKAILPEIYMMGQFYETLAKILIVFLSMIVCYFLMIQLHPHTMSRLFNIIAPLFIVYLISAEISTHFMNCSSVVGDTISFMYTTDIDIEKGYYGQMIPYSCPDNVKEIIQDVRLINSVDD